MHALVGTDLRQRKAGYRDTRDDQCRGEQHIPAKMCRPLGLFVHRDILRDING
jgi:hypothetical protein